MAYKKNFTLHYFAMLIALVVIFKLHIYYGSMLTKEISIWNVYISESQKNYNSTESEILTLLSMPIIIGFFALLIFTGYKNSWVRKWKHWVRDLLIILIVSFLSSDIIMQDLPPSLNTSIFLINILFITLVINLFSEIKKLLIIRKRKKEVTVYENKLEEYCKIPNERMELINYGRLHRCLLVGKTDKSLKVHELNYYLPSLFYAYENENVFKPDIIIILEELYEGVHGYSILSFIDLRNSFYLGKVILKNIYLDHVNSKSKPEFFKMKLYDEILDFLNNGKDIFKVRYIDSFDDFKEIVEKWDNGNLKSKGKYDSINFEKRGEWEYYYENGNIYLKGEYRFGKTGIWTEYHLNGNVKKITNCYNSRNDIIKEFFEDGTIKFEKVHEYPDNCKHPVLVKKHYNEKGELIANKPNNKTYEPIKHNLEDDIKEIEDDPFANL